MQIKYKVAIATLAFTVLVLIEIPFYLTEPNPQPSVKDFNNWWRFVFAILLDGGGNTPNLIIILIYLACFKQKHRAAIHLLLYMQQLFLTFVLRSIYKKPRPYMQYYVYCSTQPYENGTYTCGEPTIQPYTCKGSFGLPSLHALSCTSITMYLLFDFLITRGEVAKIVRYQTDDFGSLVELPPLHARRITNLSASLLLLAGLVYTFLTGILQW